MQPVLFLISSICRTILYMKYTHNLIIIGAGSGGLSAAEFTHKLGLKKVAMIEKEQKLGGECLNNGCVPSKAILHAAKIGQENPFDHVHDSIDQIEVRSDNVPHFESLGIEVLQGKATFVDAHTVQVGDKKLTAKYFLISTGSSPFVPPIPGIEGVDILTNENIFNLKAVPGSMVIVGSGPIGTEMATAFSALGTKVTMIDRAERIMARGTKEAGDIVQEGLASRGVEFMTGVGEYSVSQSGGKKKILIGDKTLEVDELLIATGRKPHVDIGLENAGIEYDKRGIVIDDKMRTSQKHIFAVGDVTQSPKFTHLAGHQAGVAVANMLSPVAVASGKHLVPTPAITYTWPEVGTFGVSEEEALAVKGASKLFYDLHENDRAITEETDKGFISVVVDKKGKLLHGTIVAGNASELMTPLLLLRAKNMPITDIARVVIPYPTVAGSLNSVAGEFSLRKLKSLPFWNFIIRKWQ